MGRLRNRAEAVRLHGKRCRRQGQRTPSHLCSGRWPCRDNIISIQHQGKLIRHDLDRDRGGAVLLYSGEGGDIALHDRRRSAERHNTRDRGGLVRKTVDKFGQRTELPQPVFRQLPQLLDSRRSDQQPVHHIRPLQEGIRGNVVRKHQRHHSVHPGTADRQSVHSGTRDFTASDIQHGSKAGR